MEWDPRSNRIESLILREGGVSAKVGLGEKRVVSIDKIQSIGDNVLLKTKHFMRE